MDRCLILRHLAQPGSTGLSVRRALLDRMKLLLSWSAMVTTYKEAKKLFAQFLIMQVMHIEHCSELERELAEIESEPATNSSNRSRTLLVSATSPFLKSW